MVVTAAALRKLTALQRRAGRQCIGFRFDGAVGSCRMSKPILKPVAAPVPAAREFHAGNLVVFAVGELAAILDNATFDCDEAPVFGSGLTVSWPHLEGGCPNCR